MVKKISKMQLIIIFLLIGLLIANIGYFVYFSSPFNTQCWDVETEGKEYYHSELTFNDEDIDELDKWPIGQKET